MSGRSSMHLKQKQIDDGQGAPAMAEDCQLTNTLDSPQNMKFFGDRL